MIGSFAIRVVNVGPAYHGEMIIDIYAAKNVNRQQKKLISTISASSKAGEFQSSSTIGLDLVRWILHVESRRMYQLEFLIQEPKRRSREKRVDVKKSEEEEGWQMCKIEEHVLLLVSTARSTFTLLKMN